ncbi:MAG: hypothetical protein RL557_65 [archaeon]|jgi:hypothetical protein
MFSVIEIFAFIFIAISIIKIAIVLYNPKIWVDRVVKKIWFHDVGMLIVSLVLSGIVLYFILEELTIVQIFAVMLFMSLLLAAGISMYSKEIVKTAERLYETDLLIQKSLPYIIIWLVLLLWGLKELFF